MKTSVNTDVNAPPKHPALFLVAAAVTGLSALAFGAAAVSVAVRGTGASIPQGATVVEGEVLAGRLTRSPAGEDFLVGEVTLGRPAASTAVDHRWRGPAGDRTLGVETSAGTVVVEVPPVSEWRGRPATDERVVQRLDGLPIVSDVDGVEAQLTPPYAIAVRALRPGDAIVAELGAAPRVGANESAQAVAQLFVGTRAQLEGDLRQREAMRWPMVFLLGLMAVACGVLALRAQRRAAAGAERPDASA
ncbi:MAG: hypothetical protein AAF411_02655 [Myxococcota bacterium]